LSGAALLAASECARHGLVPIPIKWRTKVPAVEGWTDYQPDEQQIQTDFSGECGVALLLGRRSRNLVDIDLDDYRARLLAPEILPQTGMVHGRESARGSHRWYRAAFARPECFRDPTDRAVLVEIRADRQQTVIPPSLHPCGEPLEWEADEEPAAVDASLLRRATARVAAGSLLARHWPALGSRHNAAMALAGTLIRGRWTVEDSAQFVSRVAWAAGDEEWEERARDVRTTAEKLRAGEPATGAPSLARLMPEAVVRAGAEWLGIRWDATPVRARNVPLICTTRLSDVTPKAVSWLWPSRIPRGKVTVLDGDPGLGKSTLLLDLGARVSTGKQMPDGSWGASGRMLLISAEDDVADTIQPRLVAAGADLSRIEVVTEIRDEDGLRLPELPRDLDAFEAAVQRHAAVLVIVDPLMAYLGAKVDSHRDQDVRRVLAGLRGVAERTGAAVVLVRHLNKSVASVNPLYRGGGSIGIVGAARSGLLVAKDPQDPGRRILAVTKANLSACPPSIAFQLVQSGEGVAAVEWLGESSHKADDLLVVAAEGPPAARAAAVEFLRCALAEGPVAVDALKVQTRAAGLAWRTVQRAKTQLDVQARRRGFGAGGEWEWFLPKTAIHRQPST